jgi:hypothetical protein
MKLFKSLLVAPAALGLLAPLSASANQVNIKDISNYSDIENVDFANSFEKEESVESTLLAGGEGLVDTSSFDGGFSTTTSASFGADFVVGAVDGAAAEAVTFDYQFGMNLSTSFTGEDSLALTIETGNSGSASGSVLDMNAMSDAMTLDGISYTFPLGDKTTVMVGDSTDVSALYSTSCVYSAFTDLLSNCGSGTAAGLGGGSDFTASPNSSSSATIAAAYDFGNGFTFAGGISGAGGDGDGLFTKESKDVFGVQAAYNTDSYGVSVSYASTDLTTTTESTFWGLNGFYTFEGTGLPSISVGYESEDPEGTDTEEGYFVGLTWAEVGPGSVSLGMSSNENYTSAQTETYTYEAAYTYPINDGMTITPGVFIKELDGSDDQTGLIVKTSFSF